MMRKGITGDSRKSTPMEKAVKETNKAMEEAFFGKKKKQGGKKNNKKMFESLCDDVLGIVKRWVPKKKYSKDQNIEMT